MPNPEQGKKSMPVETLENIVSQVIEGKGRFVDPNFQFVFTSHYNEILLYEHFEEMLKIFAKYGVQTMVLSNGVPFTKDKVDIIKNNQNAVAGILLNIPSYEKESWSVMTKFNKGIFDKVLENIDYMFDALPEMAERGMIQLVVNGIDMSSLPEFGGTMQPLDKMPEIDLELKTGHLAKTKEFYTNRYPLLSITTNNSLIDRAGYLAKENVMTNLPTIVNEKKKDKTRVIGCSDSWGRTDSWMHINANADVFLCCDDYDFDTVYANINDKSIEEIWKSSERKEAIKKAYSTLCTGCVHAIWGD